MSGLSGSNGLIRFPGVTSAQLVTRPKSVAGLQIAISAVERQVRMLLRTKVRYHVRAAGEVYIWARP